MVNSFAVISPDKVGCVKLYFPASAPLNVYPEVLMVIPVPTFADAKVNTGEPPNDTSSPPTTPLSVAVPEADPAVVSSYTLSSPVNPVMVKVIPVISPDKVG